MLKPVILTVVFLTNVLKFELAVTDAEKVKGMMYRKSWAPIDGMIFVNRYPQRVSYWMKNTTLPMAMVFLDSDLNVLEKHDPRPLSTSLVSSSNTNVRYVLELRPALTNQVLGRPDLLKRKLDKELRKYARDVR
jgi:uncharacterized protein